MTGWYSQCTPVATVSTASEMPLSTDSYTAYFVSKITIFVQLVDQRVVTCRQGNVPQCDTWVVAGFMADGGLAQYMRFATRGAVKASPRRRPRALLERGKQSQSIAGGR